MPEGLFKIKHNNKDLCMDAGVLKGILERVYPSSVKFEVAEMERDGVEFPQEEK